ncbi:hypothetical protein RFI_28248 [Reticulomyxa filosa]|uniref:Uncharacterized protein n=1 Tax=Reticulomyxa filosa TaxID=46433 RepID=X6M5E6_RETFI|nr:hypothetical protein RFI_28248 [Reticulomyxa filosa]|eukprot:ETO09139.1 hypothetical protein RFI_28248 [Reticulomyxa filosa]
MNIYPTKPFCASLSQKYFVYDFLEFLHFLEIISSVSYNLCLSFFDVQILSNYSYINKKNGASTNDDWKSDEMITEDEVKECLEEEELEQSLDKVSQPLHFLCLSQIGCFIAFCYLLFIKKCANICKNMIGRQETALKEEAEEEKGADQTRDRIEVITGSSSQSKRIVWKKVLFTLCQIYFCSVVFLY